MTTYAERVRPVTLPRIPLEGSLDLTYRCNNDCRHCWLRIPPGDKANQDELSFDEIRDIVDQARALGTRRWSLSGGEPMLRPDFPEIFDYITSRSVGYSLNTNGMLITPEIAQLMRRPGNKMVAVYGATAEVHDHITRHPGAFEATMRGFAYLREAGVINARLDNLKAAVTALEEYLRRDGNFQATHHDVEDLLQRLRARLN